MNPGYKYVVNFDNFHFFVCNVLTVNTDPVFVVGGLFRRMSYRWLTFFITVVFNDFPSKRFFNGLVGRLYVNKVDLGMGSRASRSTVTRVDTNCYVLSGY